LDTYSQPSDQPLDTYSSDDEPMHSHYNPNDQSCPDNSQLLHTINKMFIKYVPFSSSLGPDASLIGIFVAFIAVCLPMTCSCCRSQRNISKVNKMLESERGHRKNVDAHIKNLTDSKVKLESDLKNLQVELKFCQENLENEKQGVWDLENIRANLELDKKNLLGWNEQTKQERDSFAVSIEQMKMEKEQADNQLSVILGERANMIEQISGMEKQLQYAIQLRQEAEAAKIQLEEDIYKIREDFDKLNEEHKKVSEEYDDVKGQYEERCDELMEVKDQLENTKEDNVNKDKELTILKECVQKLSEVDGEEMESKLGKIEAMLDTTRAQTDLREMKNERDKLKEELIAKEEAQRELEETNESLEDQLMNIKAENEKLTQELQETQQKFKGITEYFERKEVNLHKKIGQEEMVRLKVELREATAKEKAELAEQEREKEREELKELRKQMADIEKSLMQKVVINEKRAEESLVSSTHVMYA
jgi:chromosome segregation ATPase